MVVYSGMTLSMLDYQNSQKQDIGFVETVTKVLWLASWYFVIVCFLKLMKFL